MAVLLAASAYCLAIDGDTAVCRVGMERVHLRLNGIDSAELPGHCQKNRHCAPGDPYAAKANLAQLITGKRVHWIDLGRDRYGRTIAQVRVGHIDVQCRQLKGGFAIYKPKWDNQGLTAKACKLGGGNG
jgi:endonuclease YncB( thermonuclease family)